jgi:octaprenyl-diphosphate synthase
VTLLNRKTSSLEQIRTPIAEELKAFDRFFKEALRSKVGLIDLIARYIIRQKGKRVRPILVLLSAKACGGITERTYRGATLVEILHTATLIHDDVVDGADTRRGLASINAVWKNKVAVLMGDYLLARGLLLSLEQNEYAFLHATSTAVKRMSEGELLQIQKSRQLDIDEATYFTIIGNKTASLFSTCTEIGAVSATDDPGLRRILKEFGEHVGMAFQIRDDLLDYLGRRSILGKPIGIDIQEKKLTLPLIHALTRADRSEAKRVLKVIKNGATQKEVEWVVEFVEEHGGIEYAVSKAEEYAMHARQNLSGLPETDAKESLLMFVEFVTARDS